MVEHRVRFPGAHDQADVIIALQPGAPEPRALISYFEDAVDAGARFAAGETVQYGWALLLLQADTDGALSLWEPDFKSMPIAWSRGCGQALRHAALQHAVCEIVRVEPAISSLRQPAVVSAGFPTAMDGFVMSREPDDGGGSGWLLRELEPPDHDATLMSLYQAAIAQPRIIPFLALPPGTTVTYAGRTLIIAGTGFEATSATSDLLRSLRDFRG